MFKFLRIKSYCPFCENSEDDIISLSFKEVDKYNYPIHKYLEKRTSKVKLIINEEYRVYECYNCNTFLLINGRDFIRVDKKIDLIRNWYKDYSNISENIEKSIKKIGFSNIGESLEAILPCKIKIGEIKYDFTTLIASKYLPIYRIFYFNKHLSSENYFFIEDVDELNESKFSISKEIRNSRVDAGEVRKNYYPTILEDRKKNKALIEGSPLFFNSQNIIGSDLKIAEQKWDEKTDYVEDYTTRNKAILLIRTKKHIKDINVAQQRV